MTQRPGPDGDVADVDAVVLAGGRARRLGGVDKLALTDADGVRVLDRVIAAVAGCGRIVVVGPPRGGLGDVVLVREDPPYGGPVAAVAAALPNVRAPWVLLLAGDQPRVAPGVAALRAAVAGAHVSDADGVVLVDDEGRRQWLCAAYRTAALREAMDVVAVPAPQATRHGASLRAVLGALALLELPDAAAASDDVDDEGDVSRLLQG